MKFSLRRSPAQTGWCLGDIQMELVGRMVSERRQRKAIEKMQAALQQLMKYVSGSGFSLACREIFG